MYSRKFKLSKKKIKSSSLKTNVGGSNWGPRIALYEREKALQQHQHPQQQQQQQQQSQSTSSSSTGTSIAPASNSANYDYNYVRNPPSNRPHNHNNHSHNNHIQSNNSNTIILSNSNSNSHSHNNHASSSGSSSNSNNGRSNSNSVSGSSTSTTKTTTIKAALNTNLRGGSNYSSTTNEVFSKPLSVIIPPPERFGYGFGGYGFVGNGKSDDSLPSTQTYRSSEDENEIGDSDCGSNANKSNNNNKNIIGKTFDVSISKNGFSKSQPPPRPPPPDFGILALSTTEPQVHPHPHPPQPLTVEREADSSEPVTLDIEDIEDGNEEDDEHEVQEVSITMQPDYSTTGRLSLDAKCPSPRSKVNGSTIAALAQGITMVYVPMESLSRKKSAKAIKAAAAAAARDDASILALLENISLKSSSPQTSSEISTGFLTTDPKDPDADSLLESFDSVIFKPKLSPSPNSCASTLSEPSPSSSTKFIEEMSRESPSIPSVPLYMNKNPRPKQMIPDSPPPLPPKNKLPEPDKTKNLRFALDKLDQLHSSSYSEHSHSYPNSHESNRKMKKVTLTLPGHDASIQREIMVNYEDENLLSCGHYKNDNYSTLSSINSAQVSDDENEDSPSHKVDPRSALQQLRDLSLLIGGNFHSATLEEDAFRLPGEKGDKKVSKDSKGKQRRNSDATDNSADSGKGSGSSPPGNVSNSNSSPTSSSNSKSNCSCGYSACVFRPDCNECLMFNKQPFEKPSNSEELCSHSNDDGSNNHAHHSHGPSNSVRIRSVRRQPKLKRTMSRSTTSSSSSRLVKPKPKKPVILDYCECKNCDNRNQLESNLEQSLPQRRVSKISKPVLIKNLHKKSTGSISQVPSLDANILFTIEEGEENPVGGIGSGTNNSTPTHSHSVSFMLDGNNDLGDKTRTKNNNARNGSPDSGNGNCTHWHPQCWLATDATMGWSDLESLYSQNMKSESPISINDECWTCWKELSESKQRCFDPNRTVDRTKRMFIWLNRRHKEFNAPWWEAKKQASIRWVVTKAFAHLPKNSIMDPFKESKRGKPTRYRLREEVIKGLVNGKLYCMTLDNLYQTQQQQYHSSKGLTHWDIIKILSRRGVYVASPSDMKLTEGTLRQKKPIRIAAHIALIEAIMGLYAKEILGRERITATLKSFGEAIEPDSSTSEQLVIAWINAAMLTLKSYIMSNCNKSNQKMPTSRVNRWIHVPAVDEIRDLADGIGICSLFALYCCNDLRVGEIAVPEPGEPLTIYDSISNHSIVQKLCEDLFPESIYHLCVTDFLYIHGYMKQNILCFLVDLFNHLELDPVIRVNRLTHVPIRIEL